MTEPTTKPAASRRGAITLALFFVGPWVVYAILLALQPADPFVAWHGQVAWPAEHFLTRSQGGLAMPIFAHVMVGLIGGAFVALAVTGVFRAIARISGRRNVGGSIVGAAFIIMPLWAFIVFKAVPETVTVIDRQAHRVEVHHFHPFLRYPTGVVTISGDDLRALDLTTSWTKRTGDRSLQLRALTADGTLVELAERTCDASDVVPCLSEGDADLVRLAEWLGHPGGHVVVLPGRHGLVVGE